MDRVVSFCLSVKVSLSRAEGVTKKAMHVLPGTHSISVVSGWYTEREAWGREEQWREQFADRRELK